VAPISRDILMMAAGALLTMGFVWLAARDERRNQRRSRKNTNQED
jgi:hypothetical protein